MRTPNLFFKFFPLVFWLLLDTQLLLAERTDATRQLQLTVDNDAYFFTDYDRYYSSGVFASYSYLVQRPFLWKGVATKEAKFSADFRLSHYMYTPKNILWRNLDQLDRPYAGMVTAGAGFNYLFPSSAVSAGIELGWLGPATKTAELQTWWHERLNIRLPRGWEYQVNNTPVIQLQPEYYRRLPLGKSADLVAHTLVSAGTVLNRLQQGVVFRYGKPGALNQSHLTNSLLGAGGKFREWYLFASFHGSWVLYNATIDGNFIGERSAYTEVSAPFVGLQTYGVVFAGEAADFELVFKRNSREVIGAEPHRYMRAKVTYRF